jgi:hypothetical protein
MAETLKRIYSRAALLNGRAFTGSFAVDASNYTFSYAPSTAEIVGRKLQLRGRLTVKDAKGRERMRDNVRAVLTATQGGIGAAPIRRQVMVGGVQTGTASTSGQQQQIAGDPPRTGQRPGEQAPTQTKALPDVESTGPLSFCGVMYFHFEPLDGRAFGVTADLSRVQLNARLAPTDERGRTLHSVYSAIVDALYSKDVKESAAAAFVRELNSLLKG